MGGSSDFGSGNDGSDAGSNDGSHDDDEDGDGGSNDGGGIDPAHDNQLARDKEWLDQFIKEKLQKQITKVE